jgi:uncharacterized protein YqeY
MNLKQQINNDYLTAYKAGEQLRVSVLRMLRAELKNKELDSGQEPNEAEVVAIIRSMIKKRNEAAEAFAAGGRQEKADGEIAEIAILAAYLPPELSENQSKTHCGGDRRVGAKARAISAK